MSRQKDYLRFIGTVKDKALIGPRTVTIHITDKCNLNCIYCWYNYPSNKETGKKFLSYKNVASLIRDCYNLGVENIAISGSGEPTLHPKINKIINDVKKRKMGLTILSNGTWPTSVLKSIYLADTVRINLSSAKREVYKRIQTADMFNKVVRNLMLLSKLKERRDLKTPNIEIVFILSKQTYKELPSLTKLAQKIGVNKIELKMMSPIKETRHLAISEEDIPELKKILIKTDTGSVKNNFRQILSKVSSKDFLNKELDSVGYFSVFSDMQKNLKCYIGYYLTQIPINGDVILCCLNKNSLVGNINKKSFKEIWNSKEAEEFRRKAKYEFNLDDKMWTSCHECIFTNFLLSSNKIFEDYKKNKKTKEISPTNEAFDI